MKKLILPLLVAIFTAIQTFAYDFSAVTTSNHTLFYSILSEEDKTVAVVPELDDESGRYTVELEGYLVIPATVEYNGITYTVKRLANSVFQNCSNLNSITIEDGLLEIEDDVFSGCPSTLGIFVPCHLINNYRAAEGWKPYKDLLVENNNPVIQQFFPVNPVCEAENGMIKVLSEGGTLPFSYNWKKQAIVEELTWNFEENMNSVEAGLDGTATLYAATNFNQTDIYESFALTPAAGGVSGNAMSVQIGTDSLASFKIELPFRNDYTPIYGNEPTYEQFYDQFNIATNTYGISFYHKGSSLYLYALDKDLKKGKKYTIPYHLEWTKVTIPWSALTKDDVVAISITSTTFEYHKSYDFGIDEVAILMYDVAVDYSSNKGLNNVSAGQYTLTVTDANGCKDTETIILNKDFSRINEEVMLGYFNPICESKTGAILIETDDEYEPYTFLWNDGSTLQNRNKMTEGEYSVSITDKDGCNVSYSVTLEKDYSHLPQYEIFTSNPMCTSDNGMIEVSSDSPYMFNWNTADWFTIADFEKGVLTWFGSKIKTFDDSQELLNSTTDISQSGIVADGADGSDYSFMLKATTVSQGAFLGFNNAGITVPLSGGYAAVGDIFSHSLGVSFYHKGVKCCVGIPNTSEVVTVPEHSDWTLVTVYWENDLGVKPNEEEIKEITWGYRHEYSRETDIQFQIDNVSLLINSGIEESEEFFDYITDLSAGEYILTATDDMGCVTSKVVTLTVDESSKPVITKEVKQAVCKQDIGEISISLQDENVPYKWNDTNERVLKRENLAPGTYIFNVSNEFGCKASDTTEIVYETFKYQPEIALVTVSQEQAPYNLVVWQKEESQAIDFYSIYRETHILGDYEKIATVKYNEPSVFVDENANSKVTSYKYKISVTDYCEHESDLSSSHRTIYLQEIQSMNAGQYHLKWTPYEGFDFSTYSIFRVTADGAEEIAMVNSGITEYTDMQPPAGTLAYYIGIVLPNEIDINEPFVKAESGPFVMAISNIAEVENQTSIMSVNENLMSVYAANNAIVVENAGEQQITICNAIGQPIVRTKGMNETRRTFAIEKGIYIVIVGNKAAKVLVE